MRTVIFLATLSGIIFIVPNASQAQQPSAQTVSTAPLQVSRDEAAKHIRHKVEPVYPPIAKAAHVMGQVVMKVSVAPDGKVSNVKVVSGPPLLIEAAVDAVKLWSYVPFQSDGSAVSALAEVAVDFNLPKQDPRLEAAEREYSSLSEKCHEAFSAGGNPEQAVSACGQMAAAADKFPANSGYIERRGAYVYYASALMRAQRYPEALTVAKKAVEVVKLGHDDGSGSSAAYAVLGNAEALNGDLKPADKDLTTAENFERAALNTPAGQELAPHYKSTLKNLLLFHAQVLDQDGRTAEAQAKRDEAAKL